MFCVSDPFLLTSTLGVFSVLLIRWESLPQDIQMTQHVLQWVSKNIALFCKARYKVNECMNCTEHFPRPPRTPTFPPVAQVSKDVVEESEESEETDQPEETTESTETMEKEQVDDGDMEVEEDEKEVQLQSNSI